MNAVEIARLKILQKIRFNADSSIEAEHPTHQYIATRVDGGFLDREPGKSLPQDVKETLISIRDLVDRVDAMNAPIFHDLVKRKRDIDAIAKEYADGGISEVEAIEQIEAFQHSEM